MSKFRLSLKEKRSPHGLEREPRYDVQVNGARVGELYHNMTGFRGSLMNEHGATVDIGERGISAWKKEAAAINRDARDRLAKNDEDERELVNWERTARGDVFELTFHDKPSGERSTLFVPEDQLFAGMALMDAEDLSPAFFDPCDPDLDVSRDAIPDVGQRVVKGILETEDEDWNAVVVGELPDSAATQLRTNGLPLVGVAQSFGSSLQDWSDGADQVLFVKQGTLIDMFAAHGTEIIPAQALPRRGMVSQRDQVFAEPITSTAQRPDILVTEEQNLMFAAAIGRSGYKARMRAEIENADTTPEPDM